MLGIWILALFLVSTARGKEVCYERLGCFSDDIPWSGTVERPVYKLPWNPEKIDTRFLLYTRENPDNFQEISAIDASTIEQSNFNASRITRFITHGFIDKGEENWLSDMCKRMFTVEDVNCICIDWKKGSRCQYTQASNNVRVVGAEIAYFVNVLMEKFGYSLANVHIIGHSLGAHVAGEAGRRRPGIGRITGLDPAQPYFQGTPIEVRLDKSDANFVDVIHTDSAPTIPNLGFGMSSAVGHLDFYPNGGEQMPGCKKNPISQVVDLDGIWEGTRDFVACNHLRSYKYYSDSIIFPDGFLGYPCASYDVFETESCFPCPKDGCPNMGHFADKFKGKIKTQFMKLYLNTGEAKNFTRWRYKVSVTLSGKSKVNGYANIALYGSNGNTKQHQIFQGSLKPDSTYTKLIDVEVNIGTVTKVKFLWNNNWINPTLPKLGAANVTVQSGENREEFHFCGSETVREDVLQTLTAC
ncbi:inactive pancreatic lipase-related protein 1-like [Apteryx mantelli]|uniref:Triacylglycerol lipase n=1 Tax=Apteryx mantelli TaxID=2696672 RepID=A0A8B7J0H0_9AVES|nr:PREDICTED: inactive pancreatic lipase-related protein 1-like [Apteryx mantelli mantelli]XP_025925513.1 inactive pancreatic lipase-related protein 1-like isoform X2 [Apteryx rowi]